MCVHACVLAWVRMCVRAWVCMCVRACACVSMCMFVASCVVHLRWVAATNSSFWDISFIHSWGLEGQLHSVCGGQGYEETLQANEEEITKVQEWACVGEGVMCQWGCGYKYTYVCVWHVCINACTYIHTYIHAHMLVIVRLYCTNVPMYAYCACLLY